LSANQNLPSCPGDLSSFRYLLNLNLQAWRFHDDLSVRTDTDTLEGGKICISCVLNMTLLQTFSASAIDIKMWACRFQRTFTAHMVSSLLNIISYLWCILSESRFMPIAWWASDVSTNRILKKSHCSLICNTVVSAKK
jgi:hypothetical protein